MPKEGIVCLVQISGCWSSEVNLKMDWPLIRGLGTDKNGDRTGLVARLLMLVAT